MQAMEPSVCYNIRFGACTTFIQFSKSRTLTITRDDTLEYKNHKFSPSIEYVAVVQYLADIIYHEQRAGRKVDMEHIMKNFQLYAEASSLYRTEMTKLTSLSTLNEQ